MEYINYYKIMLTSILFSETKNKKIILEPISCIIKLILMIYKEEGTKISILNNAIDFYEPSHLQGFLRNINGDKIPTEYGSEPTIEELLTKTKYATDMASYFRALDNHPTLNRDTKIELE